MLKWTHLSARHHHADSESKDRLSLISIRSRISWIGCRLSLSESAYGGSTEFLEPICRDCGGQLARVPRTLADKLIWSEIYACPTCKRRTGTYYRFLYAHCRFMFSRHSRCIRCGSEAVRRLMKRDEVDGFTHNPLGLILALTAAPINHCNSCRLQFFDWRNPRPRAKVARHSKFWAQPT